MGVYTEYLDQNLSFPDLTRERKKQLARIAKLRGNRDILVFAADLNKSRAPISIDYADILPITDQIANLKGDKLDLILETPGGSGEAAEDIIRILRNQYKEIGVIVPGWAKSAGTIMTMAGDEILMGPASALGPIDAQLLWQGKVFSAEALVMGFDKIKKEVETTGSLNKAYIPILQGISPGELQSAQNALDFAKKLVTDWLAKHKFRDWTTHTSTGKPVTDDERRARAEEIGTQLCKHSRWLTHGRSIKIDDLVDMRLKVVDYSKTPDLNDAIQRYYTLLQLTFQTNIYKVFETPTSQIVRFINPPAPPAEKQAAADVAIVEHACPKCGRPSKIQANLGKKHPLQEGHLPYPPDNLFKCPQCGTEANLSDVRRQIEAQAKQKVVT